MPTEFAFQFQTFVEHGNRRLGLALLVMMDTLSTLQVNVLQTQTQLFLPPIPSVSSGMVPISASAAQTEPISTKKECASLLKTTAIHGIPFQDTVLPATKDSSLSMDHAKSPRLLSLQILVARSGIGMLKLVFLAQKTMFLI